MWEHHDYLEFVYSVAVYVLLVFMGICYTIGSYIFCRVFFEPSVSPIFGWRTRYMANDELLGSWFFTIGTAPSIPCCVFYVMILPTGKYITALIACSLATLAAIYFCYACTPSIEFFEIIKERGAHFPHPTHYIVSYFHSICCCLSSHDSRIRYHYSNDWLIGAWLMLYACILATIGSIIMLLYYIYYIDLYGILYIYEWAASLIDMIVFDIGCMYILIGSYPEVFEDDTSLFQKSTSVLVTSLNTKTNDNNNNNSSSSSSNSNDIEKQHQVEELEDIDD